MARYRLSAPAKTDIASILRTSETMHGIEARIRYRALLAAAMRRISAEPRGLSTVDREPNYPPGFGAFISGIAATKAARHPLASQFM